MTKITKFLTLGAVAALAFAISAAPSEAAKKKRMRASAPAATCTAPALCSFECVGTGCNTAALLEAVAAAGLELDWWGLELDREPLRLALADGGSRGQWQPDALERLQALCTGPQMLWGDARARLPELLTQRRVELEVVREGLSSEAKAERMAESQSQILSQIKNFFGLSD